MKDGVNSNLMHHHAKTTTNANNLKHNKLDQFNQLVASQDSDLSERPLSGDTDLAALKITVDVNKRFTLRPAGKNNSKLQHVSKT